MNKKTEKIKIPQSDHLINVIQNYLLDGILGLGDKEEIAKILAENVEVKKY